ncbi:unnamed protein product [Anisakis simplex]|uniref:Phosphoribosylaminoimidazolesuccinocarboxamide synthase n=1 Tax=Anisakis simplex TaxID=6269 RepID=A0A0M3JAU4_ANISI|nr:unnamed protein product [Anisakis simplex]
MPKSTKFSVQSVKNLIGGDRIIEVIEVNCQGSRQMTLTDFIKYYRSDPSKRTVLLNVLSLEFSMSPLGEKVLSPALVREIDWVELYWPPELRVVDDSDGDFQPPFPKVQQSVFSICKLMTDLIIATRVWLTHLKK